MGAPKRPRGHPNPSREKAQEGSTGCLLPSHPNSGALCCSHTPISSLLPFPPALRRQGTHLGLRQEGSCQTDQLPLAHRQTLSPLSQLAVQSTCEGQAQQSHYQALCRGPQTASPAWGFPRSTQYPNSAQAQALGTRAFMLGCKQHVVQKCHTPVELGAGLSFRLCRNIHWGQVSSARFWHPIHHLPVPRHQPSWNATNSHRPVPTLVLVFT